VHLDAHDRGALAELVKRLEARCDEHREAGLSLDMTRGKPSIEQLALSGELDGILQGDYRLADGTDTRGYGGLEGIPEARALAAAWLGVDDDEIVVGGNSSLTMMYQFIAGAWAKGPGRDQRPWAEVPGGARFICPVPGYDRHFAICEDLGIEMRPVPLTGDGPDMDVVERLLGEDPRIVAMWCVPKYSNPTGESYGDDTVARIANLGRRARPGFRVLWDNAYAVHDLYEPQPLADVMALARVAGTADSIVAFGSTSKVTFAGAGLAFLGTSPANRAWFLRRLGVMTIGPDKVNQLRHVRFLRDMQGVRALMARHAQILRPKFECVLEHLERAFAGRGMGEWTSPRGGYFISFDTLPGLGREVVRLADDAGLRLTPAGAAFPGGADREDRNIRLAPSFPPLEEVDRAMQVFTTCVELASARKRLREMNA
jgi:aspartate/methionine/tyrosine aminotransferase